MNKELQRLKLEEQASREKPLKAREAGYTSCTICSENDIIGYDIVAEIIEAMARTENPRQYTTQNQTVLLRRRHR